MKLIEKTKGFFYRTYDWISYSWRGKQLPAERTIHVPMKSYYFMERLTKQIEREHTSLPHRFIHWMKRLFNQ